MDSGPLLIVVERIWHSILLQNPFLRLWKDTMTAPLRTSCSMKNSVKHNTHTNQTELYVLICTVITSFQSMPPKAEKVTRQRD